MCKDWHCSSCDEYDTDSCTECDPIAEVSNGNCSCLVNFQKEKYERDPNVLDKPCCAAHCETCTNAQHFKYCTTCKANYYIQPSTTTDYVVCFSDCPTGYAINDSGSCTENISGLIVSYDLTYLQDDILNLANPGFNNANGDISTTSGFTNTYAYKLRGRYSNGSTDAILISNLNLHHTYTLTTWAYLNSLDQDGAVFSKEKGGDYSQSNRENLLELQVTAAGALKANLYYNSTELFDGDSITSDGEISTGAWYAIAYIFDFDGETTNVSFYKNAALVLTHPSQGLYLEDKDSYSQAWLFVATDSVNSVMTPVRGLNGFMYRIHIWNTAEISNVTGDYTTVSCSGGCTYCPTNVGLTNSSTCLWAADRNSYVDDSNTIQPCQDGCAQDNGCVRGLDCNRCHDRLCQSCLNFDEGATCSQCIERASDLTGCVCDEQWTFNDFTDACENCHSYCHVCNSHSYKDCTECVTDHYMQDGMSVCLPYCATSYTENVDTKSCVFFQDEMFDL